MSAQPQQQPKPFVKKERGIFPSINEGHMAAPALMEVVDYSVFKRTPQENGQLYTMKRRNKDARKKEYGKDANKYLNIKALSHPETIKFTF